MFDPEQHRSLLKRAQRASLVFALSVGNKPQTRVMGLAVRGTSASVGRLTKARGGGAKVFFGHMQASPDDAAKLMLTPDGPVIPGTVKAMRLYLKEHHITLFRKFAVVVAGKEQQSESDDDGPPTELEGEDEPEVATAAPEVEQDDGAPDKPPTPEQMEVLQDRRSQFKKARAAWVAAKARAEQDLEKVKDGARMAYMADASQFPKIEAGCKAIDAILDGLDDELRDTLDRYASTPLREQKKLHALAATAGEVLDRYQSFVDSNRLMQAIDEKEFADVTVHAPIVKALADLRRAMR